MIYSLKTKAYQCGIFDVSHELGLDIYQHFISKKYCDELITSVNNCVRKAKRETRVLKFLTWKKFHTELRDNLWYGLMPICGYNECRISYLTLSDHDVGKILRIGTELIHLIKQSEGETDKYDINCVQILEYRPGTLKMPHFDGRYMTNGYEVWGITIGDGKIMSVGSLMRWGRPQNKFSSVSHPGETIYRMRGKMLWKYWHAIVKVTKVIHSIMFRVATVSTSHGYN
eukprot:431943_1